MIDKAKNVIFRVRGEKPEVGPVITEFYLIKDGTFGAPNRITLKAKDKMDGQTFHILSFAPGYPIYRHLGIFTCLGLPLDEQGRVKVEEV